MSVTGSKAHQRKRSKHSCLFREMRLGKVRGDLKPAAAAAGGTTTPGKTDTQEHLERDSLWILGCGNTQRAVCRELPGKIFNLNVYEQQGKVVQVLTSHFVW